MKNSFKFYEVGGKVRDELLGLQSKDVDYVAVPNEDLLRLYTKAEEMFNVLNEYLISEKFEVFLKTDDCFTIRAKFPEGHKYSGVADFVMARKEIGYIPNTRTPIVIPGTLYDDLERRDATLNALAKDDDGNIIDYFNGLDDLKNGILRTPLDCKITIEDDALRILRYVRFSITKGFTIAEDLKFEIKNYDYENRMGVVSEERIMGELKKCFKYDTLKTLIMFNEFPSLRDYVFTRTNLWLKPTSEK
jgi:tRNA nucleotidyltransferase/poly(A) polymerase